MLLLFPPRDWRLVTECDPIGSKDQTIPAIKLIVKSGMMVFRGDKSSSDFGLELVILPVW